MATLKLATDRQTKTLAIVNGSVTGIPALFQTNTQGLQIQVVDPTVGGIFNTSYDIVDASASGLRVVVAQTATGDEGDEAGLLLAAAYEAAFAWDAGLEAFVGEINLHTAEIAAWIGDRSSRTAIIEINLITGGVPTTLFQGQITLYANADDGGAAAPSVIADAETAGVFTIQNGVGGVVVDGTRVSITGLGLGGAPSAVYPWVECPANSGFIGCNFEVGSATADGFSVRLSAVPPNNNYKVRYVLTF